jgi:hypothetical protein
MHQQTAAHLARVQEEDKKRRAHQAEEAKKHHERGRPARQSSPRRQSFEVYTVYLKNLIYVCKVNVYWA